MIAAKVEIAVCEHLHILRANGVCEDCSEIVFPALYFDDDEAKTRDCIEKQRAGIPQKG